MKKKTILILTIIVLLIYPVLVEGEEQTIPTSPIVGIAHGMNHRITTHEAITAAGGLNKVVNDGDTVLIKPNIVGPSPSGAGRITDYRVVQEVINMVLEAGASKIIVAEGPVDDSFDYCIRAAGYNRIKNAEVIDLNCTKENSRFVEDDNLLVDLEGFYLPEVYMQADKIISVAVLKTHDIAGVTLALKNIGIGVPPQDIYRTGTGIYKARLHSFGISKTIADVNKLRPVDFAVIDGMVAGEGEGPVNPRPVRTELVIAGSDPVAVDTIGTKIMGYNPYRIPHIVYSAAKNVGTMENIIVKGVPLEEVSRDLMRPGSHLNIYQSTGIIAEKGSEIIIDGFLTEWNQWGNKIKYRDQVFMGREEWSGMEDLSANFYLTYDKENIYLALKVLDDSITENDYFNVIFGGKEFFADIEDIKVKELEKNTIIEADVNVEYKYIKTNKGYIIEMSIPRSFIWNSLINHTSYGFDIILIDADNLQEEVTKMQWNNGNNILGKNQRTGNIFVF